MLYYIRHSIDCSEQQHHRFLTTIIVAPIKCIQGSCATMYCRAKQSRAKRVQRCRMDSSTKLLMR